MKPKSTKSRNTLFTANQERITKPFLVWFIEALQYSPREFATLKEALGYAQKQGKACAFHRGTNLLGTWSRMKGFKKERG